MPLLLSQVTTFKSSQSSPFHPCSVELPEHRETFQVGTTKASPPVSQAPGPDPAVAIPLPQEYTRATWGLSMVHNQHSRLEHWGLKCLQWLQEVKHIGQAPERGFGTQSSMLPCSKHHRKHKAASIPEAYSIFPEDWKSESSSLKVFLLNDVYVY